jgi:signal transduction histidine kinase
MKLIQKFFLIFLLAALVPLLLLGVSVQHLVKGSLSEMARRMQRETAQRAAESVAGYLEKIQNALILAQNQPDFASDGRSRQEILRALLDNYSCFYSVAVFDAAGRKIQASSRAPDNWGDAAGLWPQLKRQASAEGVWLGPVTFSPSGGLPRALLAVPVGPDPDRPAGFLAARLNLLDAGSKLRSLDVGGGLALLFGPDGKLITHSGNGDILAGAWPAGDMNEGEALRGGKPFWWAREKVNGIAEGWTVVFEQPMERVFGVVGLVRGRIGIFTFVSAVLALVLCWLVTGKVVVKRLGEIQKAVEAIRQRRFNLFLKADSKDEIGELGRRVLDAAKTLETDVRTATIGVMVQKISHDIRKPFTNIRASLETARRHIQTTDPVAQKHLGYISESADQGMEYIEEMLTLGKDRRPPQKTLTDVNALVRDLKERTPVPAGVEVALDLAEAPRCALDPAEAVRALSNIFENAVNALPAVNGRVTLRTRAASHHLEIEVEDNGAGMSEETRAQLFNDFFTTRTGGTGLGMGIVKRVMERHAGDIRVKSQLGRGTSVTLLFPLAPVEKGGLLHA